MTYCVSDYGWSDTWFVGSNPNTYTQPIDVLSGDNAVNIRYVTASQQRALWLSPSLDSGTLVPQSTAAMQTGPTFNIVTAVHLVTGNNQQAQSVIQNTDLRITITTTVSSPGVVSQRYDILNRSASAAVTNFQLADYFNLHPNGSAGPNASTQGDPNAARNQGRTTYSGGTIYTQGNRSLASFVTAAQMHGQQAPNAWMVGYANCTLGGTGCVTLWNKVASNTWDFSTGPLGPGDTAGALRWDLGTIAPNAQISFTVFKELEVPEPATLALLAIGLAGIGWRRRRQTPALSDLKHTKSQA